MAHRSDDKDETGLLAKELKNVNLSDETLKEEEDISELVNTVFQYAQEKLSVQDKLIEESIKEIKEKFKTYHYLNTDFHKDENLCGFFYCYSTLNAAVVRHRILAAVKECKDLQNKLDKTEINLISLGGGPGTDLVGFCSAIQEYESVKDIERQRIFNYTTIDYVDGWKYFYDLLQRFIREGNYGNVSAFFKKHNVSLNFLYADLFSQTLSTKYENELKQADIVLLSRVLDSYNFKEINPEGILKIFIPRMKKDALLLFIDCFDMNYATEGLVEIYKLRVSDLEYFTLTFCERETKFPKADRSKATISVYKKP